MRPDILDQCYHCNWICPGYFCWYYGKIGFLSRLWMNYIQRCPTFRDYTECTSEEAHQKALGD